MTSDPTGERPRSITELPSTWRPWNRAYRRIGKQLGDLYAELGIEGVSTRFSMAIMFLEEGALAIRDLAGRCGVTHSAMSQSVAAMRRAGLVTTAPGADARSRMVALTDQGRELAPMLWREWYATEAALAELDAELSRPLSALAAELDAALDRESFTARVRRHLGP